jgi:hypothetical protein
MTRPNLGTDRTGPNPGQVGPDGPRAPSPSQKKGGDAGKPTTPKLQEASSKPYEPTPADKEALEGYARAQEKMGPRLKVTGESIAVDHPDLAYGQLALMKAIGSSDIYFLDGLISQIANVGSKGDNADERGTNFVLAVIKGIEPRDQVEAMLAAQMAAVHNATMIFARRLAHVETITQQDSAQNAFNKLARTFAAQTEALKRYRSGGEQKMTVQHVHVAEGGQAIVGNVNAPTEGVGPRKKPEVQPHALAYAPGVEMPRQVEENRETVPIAGGAGS